MFARRFFQKSGGQQPPSLAHQGDLTASDLDPHVVLHYGIPSTASILAFDPIQSLLAVGTLDGRIKVIGGDNIEGLLVSTKQQPLKYLEFIRNQGFLVSVSTENEIQVWDLEHRKIASSILWESNITAFAVIHGTGYMYIGDEYGMVYVLKCDAEERKLIQLPYYVPTDVLGEAAGSPSINHPVVGILPQPCSQGNKVLIAFSNGLIILWDASEDHVLLVRGNKDLLLMDEVLSGSQGSSGEELSGNVSDDQDLVGKEISSLCWASTDGSVLAVGYIDGDILFWNLLNGAPVKDRQTRKSSNNVVKLQISSGERRLPVIVMHWQADKSSNDYVGKLFMYGGDDIGSEEVLTMLSLDWSSGLESLKCTGRVDLTLHGSFADMVLSPVASGMQSCERLLFLLTNPGELYVYDEASLAALISKEDKRASISPLQYPMVTPTMAPSMTMAKLTLLNTEERTSMMLSEIVSAAKLHSLNNPSAASPKWPLTGGVPCQPFTSERYQVKRLYLAGYQDGSVRIWDATHPALFLIYTVQYEVQVTNIAGTSASISAMDLCSLTSSLAIGDECGMVRLYKVIGHKGETTLNFVTETDKQVHMLKDGNGPKCLAVFSLIKSPVCSLQFAKSGVQLAVGFKCGRVAMLDISTSSVVFIADNITASSPISSLSVKSISNGVCSISNSNGSGSENLDAPEKLVVFVMTKDADIFVLDGSTGSVLSSGSKHQKRQTAISMYIVENCNLRSEAHSKISSLNTSHKSESEENSVPTSANCENITPEGKLETSMEVKSCAQQSTNLVLLLCCEDALFFYYFENVMQGDIECIREVKLSKPSCWTTIYKKDEEECGLVVLYLTGLIEIRSFPNLEVVGESTLASLLRWNFKSNMDRTLSSDDSGHITMISGGEFALLSLLSNETDFRVPESLPSLHDKVLAAASDAVDSQLPSQKKSQAPPKFLEGIIKGFRASNNTDHQQVHKESFSHLERIFYNPPFLKPSLDVNNDENVVELSIDDIIIDEPVPVPATTKSKTEKTDKGSERERLFEGASTDAKPRMRTVEEIKAKYKKPEDASSAASEARNKLLERQEKLDRISQRTEELQNGAEDFASLATQLAKQMERRKWWQL